MKSRIQWYSSGRHPCSCDKIGHCNSRICIWLSCCLRWQCSFGAFVVMDMKKDFPNCCKVFPETHVRSKRKRPTPTSAPELEEKNNDKNKKSEAVLCLRYNSMLHLDFVGPREMIVVEQPWLNVVANFPEALQRRVYGA
jgi:hypothetical protein